MAHRARRARRVWLAKIGCSYRLRAGTVEAGRPQLAASTASNGSTILGAMTVEMVLLVAFSWIGNFVVLFLLIPAIIRNFEPENIYNTKLNALIVAGVLVLGGSGASFAMSRAGFNWVQIPDCMVTPPSSSRRVIASVSV